MKLENLLKNFKWKRVQGDIDIEINGVTYDSRKALPGTLFVCIDGYSTDGHQFAQSAIDNGATCLIVEKSIYVPENITVIQVENARFALAGVSAEWFNHPADRIHLIGVTGTKGKTTTTYMIKSIFEEADRLMGIIGSIANCIGNEKIPARRTTPESYDLQELFEKMMNRSVDSCVMEVTSQGLKLNRVDFLPFEIGVFTNFSQDHIGGNEHADMNEYFSCKQKLFRMCKKGIVNADADRSDKVISEATCPILTYGIRHKADITISNLITHSDKSSFIATTPWFEIPVTVSAPGIFNVYNALAAIAVCGMSGIPAEAIQKGLTKVQVPGRTEIVPTPGCDYTVMIDFAHTPDSLANILKAVKEFAAGRVISVFGCGGDRDRSKRPLMGEISTRIADYSIITSDNPRTEEPASILKDIEAGISNKFAEYMVIEDRTSAIRYAMSIAKPGDVIVLAGKGHETYQMFKDKTIHYDEREVVENLLKELV
jgi:UDP-N-acetylmuramoyl-L-alanyl-D-glutamate--2,6-diaminopimelate ligase